MYSKLISNKIYALAKLIRLDKPIGFTLLMWPCWFALAILPINDLENIKWYFYLFIGALLMRSAGCIINDLIDINIDRKVERTLKRPLVAKSVSISESLILLFFLLFLSLLILLQFNLKVIFLGFVSIPLIILYPFMKRYTYWPQLVLGIVFNIGILITSLQFNNSISHLHLILYFGCIFWTLGYDTIYAYQDKNDDIKHNIKSTAVLFDSKGKKYVFMFYLIFFCILGFIGFQKTNSIASICVLLLILIATAFFLNKWKLDSKSNSNNLFRLNNYLGLLCFVYLVIFK